MVTLDNTLERIALSFTVRDIMVPVQKLVKASDEISARQLLVERKEFDVIPILKDGEIFKYVERNTNQARFVTIADTISDATSIFDTVDILWQRRFGFVLGRNQIVGYVHFSDLNNSVVKIPFYVMFEALEYALTQRIQGHITEETLRIVIGSDRVDTIVKKMRTRREKNIDLGWASHLYFREILSLARHFSFVQITDDDLDSVAVTRNRVDHATDPLIRDFKGIIRLARAKQVCLALLDGLKDE